MTKKNNNFNLNPRLSLAEAQQVAAAVTTATIDALNASIKQNPPQSQEQKRRGRPKKTDQPLSYSAVVTGSTTDSKVAYLEK